MSSPSSKSSKKKLSFFQLIKVVWKPYCDLSGFLKPYRLPLVLGLLAGVGFALVNGCLPLVIQKVGGSVFKGNMSPTQFLTGAVQNQGPGIEKVLWICLLVPVIMLVRSILSYANTYCLTWVSLKVLRDIRRKVFGHLMEQSLDFFNRSQSGRLSSRVLNDTRVAQEALVGIIGDVIKEPLTVIAMVIVVVRIDWKFSLVTLVLFPICLVPLVVYGRRVRKAGKAEENEAGIMSVILQESFAGIRVIKSFAREHFQLALFDKSSDIQFNSSLSVQRSSAIVQPMIETVSAFGVSLALFYVYFGQLGLGKFMALMTGMFLLYEPVKKVSRIHLVLQKCLSASTSIFELLATQPTIKNVPHARPLVACHGKIELKNLHFHYGLKNDLPALKEINLHIEPGQKIALVGPSGAGKSTLLALLLRFYDPQEGAVLIDGHDVRQLQLHSLREQLGIVTQESFLFHDTIYENIRFGRLDATRSEIEEAAQQAFAHDFIVAQPKGYETMVGDKGCLLSGGQQQRLAIARALLKSAPILLLDEATSALDSESERMIQVALERLASGRTVIAIAHRLSTVLGSDVIVVMDQGRIVAQGRHQELLGSSEVYRNLYELQFHHALA
ncbi:MAG: ABC transporter ATP-binding protein/permease [Chthoniobacterales bacterium]|nr:ABC transporter ATP-binding protein/permease [Chthoniobacterales bacterium]